MVCLQDALKIAKDPTAAPCSDCIVESLRNPLGEALARLASSFQAERDAEPKISMPGYTSAIHRAPNKELSAARKAEKARNYKRGWRIRKGLQEA